MKLYGYFRSSAAYRVRIALNLKKLSYESIAVDLRKGQQYEPAYLALNPQGRVPALDIGGGVLTQSLAIIAYLDEIHPEPPFLPADHLLRAYARAFALTIACDIHPLNNLSVLTYLRDDLRQDEAAVSRWYRHWIESRLPALERTVADTRGEGVFCFGARPSLADIFLVPQLYNARRFGCSLAGCARLIEIDEACRRLAAFAEAAPERQPDAS